MYTRTHRHAGKHAALRVEEIVREDQLPEFRIDLDFLDFEFLEPRRDLEPRRKITVPDKHWQPNCEINCQIVRAINVPIRTLPKSRSRGRTNTTDSITTTSNTTADSFLDDRVRPFVKIRFQDSSLDTSCQEGPGPIWNEVLRLPVKLPDGQKEVTPRRYICF